VIENFIDTARLIKNEPALQNYFQSNQLNYDDISSESYEEYLNDVKNQRIDLRKLGIRLPLVISSTQTSATDNPWTSNDDIVERRRLIIDVTACVGNAVFSLQGSPDTTVVTDIRTNIVISQAGNYSYIFQKTFKRYRLRLLSIGTSITYSSELYETTFDEPLLCLTLSNIFGSLYHSSGKDAFQDKFKYYRDKYLDKLVNTHYFYDEDESGLISLDEALQSQEQITLRP
jgi:hypothetical protein